MEGESLTTWFLALSSLLSGVFSSLSLARYVLVQLYISRAHSSTLLTFQFFQSTHDEQASSPILLSTHNFTSFPTLPELVSSVATLETVVTTSQTFHHETTTALPGDTEEAI
jgi:hypothetical protein